MKARLVIVPGPGGVAVDIAQRVAALADGVVVGAVGAGAAALLALHHGDGRAAAWVHPRASIASRLYAGRLAGALGVAVPPAEDPAAWLDPRALPPGCAACGVDLARLGDVGSPSLRRREELAEAVARGAFVERHEAFDIWHEVPLVQQLTGMSCWAAAAAMIVGWRDCIEIRAEDVAAGSGRAHAYRDGLEPRDVDAFAAAWGLEVARPRDMSVAEIRRLLETYGPLWVGEASPGLHVIVIAGMFGDGTVDGTRVRIADPWPLGTGERYTIGFRELRENLIAATRLSGGTPQILHAAAGARGGAR